MREILFRGKRLDNGEWVYGSFLQVEHEDGSFTTAIFQKKDAGGAEELYSSGYIILPIPFNDFDVIKEASKGADAMSLNSLLNFYNSADKYGFSKEVFCHSLINRLLQPLFYLVLFLIIAIVSWHCRINEDTLFKFHWIYVFPLLLLIFISLHEIVISFYKFVNFSILGSFGSDLSLLIGFFFAYLGMGVGKAVGQLLRRED